MASQKLINLDQFKKVTSVILNEVVYDIKGVTVGMFLDDIDFDKLRDDNNIDSKERVKALVSSLLKMSNIPENVLYEQSFEVLNKLIIIAQGGDIDAQGGEDSPTEKKS